MGLCLTQWLKVLSPRTSVPVTLPFPARPTRLAPTAKPNASSRLRFENGTQDKEIRGLHVELWPCLAHRTLTSLPSRQVPAPDVTCRTNCRRSFACTAGGASLGTSSFPASIARGQWKANAVRVVCWRLYLSRRRSHGFIRWIPWQESSFPLQR